MPFAFYVRDDDIGNLAKLFHLLRDDGQALPLLPNHAVRQKGGEPAQNRVASQLS